jgi:acetylornithine deacetylase
MKTQEILKDLIRIDSQCTKSNKKIIEYISDLLKDFEIQKFDFKKDGLTLSNLVVKIPGNSSDIPIIFAGHTDTVPKDEEWTLNPLEPIEKEGKIYGLGSTDMKSGLACMISAVLSLKKKPKHDVYLLLDADEELGGVGVKKLLQSFFLENARVILAEPSDGKIIYAHKGCLDMILEFKGFGGHSSQADFNYCKEHSAVHKAIEAGKKILEYSQEIEKKKDVLLGKPTLNIGIISGGTAANKVANSCQIQICRRLIPSESIEEEYKKIIEIIYSVDSKAEITPTFWISPFNGNKEGYLAKQILEFSSGIMPSLTFGVAPSTTEAGLFQRYGDTLIFGPGSLDLAHKPDEYVKTDSLDKFTEVYKKLMENV